MSKKNVNDYLKSVMTSWQSQCHGDGPATRYTDYNVIQRV